MAHRRAEHDDVDLSCETFLEEAIESEIAYYSCSARVVTGPNWMATQLPGFEHVVSAGYCYWHPVPTETALIMSTLADIDSALAKMGATHTRLYTRHLSPHFASILRQLGFQSRRETIHAHTLRPSLAVHVASLRERIVQSKLDWRDKQYLHDASGQLSDGHHALAADWIEMEIERAAAGRVRFYLYEFAGQVVATAGLMKSGCVMRLKDVLVHPRFRRMGIARTALALLCQHASSRPVVLFAIDGSAGQRLYHSMGFQTVGTVYESIRKR